MVQITSLQERETRQRITGAAVIVMGSVLCSAVLGLVREIVLAGYGGIGSSVDAYVNAFAIPEVINHILAGSFLTITFIPIFTGYLVAGDKDSCNRIFSNIFFVATSVLTVVIAFCMVFTAPLIKLTNPGISDPVRFSLTVDLVRIILPAQIFIFWGSLFKSVQYANKKFLLPSLSPVLYNGGIICGGIFLAPHIGIKGFCWGVLAGAFAGNVLIQLPGAFKTGLLIRPVFNLKDKDLRKYIYLTIPLVLGIGMTFSNEFLLRFFGSYLGTGGSASLNYSMRATMFIVNLFGSALGVASFPFLADLAAKKDYLQMNRIINGIISRIFVAIIPVSLILAMLSKEYISVLYEHGKFTPEATLRTAPVLVFYLLGSFAFCSQIIIIRSYYACQRTWFAAIFSTIAVLLSLPFYFLASRTMGARGIALVSSCSVILQFIILFTLWSRQTHNPGISHLFIIFLKVIFMGMAASGSVIIAKYLLIRDSVFQGFLPDIGLLIISGGSGLIVYSLLGILLKVNELKELFKSMISKAGILRYKG
ncbi:MAG: murein biosynthesis integral membrane protein MurJ [bacterium]